MKIYIFLLLVSVSVKGDQFLGGWLSQVQENIRTDYVPVRVYSNKVIYTKGGIDIQYPQNYFSSAPHVCTSLELNNSNAAQGISFTSIITAADVGGAKIVVHKYQAGYLTSSFVEAGSDDVYVHVFAFGY